ncbi:transposase, partial [Pseudanabaena sp. CCNP1317]
MTECNQEAKIEFYKKKRLEVKFSGEQLSSEGGILLVRQAEEKVKIIEEMAERIEDKRDQNKIRHSMEQLIQQRVLQIAGGYEDAIDSNQLRKDPILKIACNRLPIDEEEELLASQSTMTRLENRIAKSENKA